MAVPRITLDICRDPADDMGLECCLAARADMLLTGDKDLLTISREHLRRAGLGMLRIVSPGAILRSI